MLLLFSWQEWTSTKQILNFNPAVKPKRKGKQDSRRKD